MHRNGVVDYLPAFSNEQATRATASEDDGAIPCPVRRFAWVHGRGDGGKGMKFRMGVGGTIWHMLAGRR